MPLNFDEMSSQYLNDHVGAIAACIRCTPLRGAGQAIFSVEKATSVGRALMRRICSPLKTVHTHIGSGIRLE
jgi:hypothetical protein